MTRGARRRKRRLVALRRPRESLKTTARRVMAEGLPDEPSEDVRDAENWLIGKVMGRGKTHGEAVMKVFR